MNSKTYPKPASESLKQAVREIIGGDGKAYAEIPHPDFTAWPTKRKAAKRQKLIEPHLEYRGGTALDIGTYLGAFSHWLEDLGLSGHRRRAQSPVRRRRAPTARSLGQDVRDSGRLLPRSHPDQVRRRSRLNVFYQSLRRPNSFTQLEEFLPRLDCHMMIFESHDPSALPPVEGRPDMSAEEFVRFIADRSGLSDVQEIGKDGPRTLYKLKRPADGRAKDSIIEIKPAAPFKKAAPAAKARPAKETKPAKEPKPPITVAALALLLDAGVEKLVGDHIGCAVRQLDKKEHIRPKVSQGKRRYFRHMLETIEANPRRLDVFFQERGRSAQLSAAGRISAQRREDRGVSSPALLWHRRPRRRATRRPGSESGSASPARPTPCSRPAERSFTVWLRQRPASARRRKMPRPASGSSAIVCASQSPGGRGRRDARCP